jgi:mono/diheme cytochrome c family protein
MTIDRVWAAFCLALLAASVAGAQEPKRAINPEHPGFEEYRRYCGACHGVFADGKGPVAAVLKKPPSDLTQLGEKYGLPLPRNKLLRFIDGRDEFPAHGSREMPVWGERLYEDFPGPEREMAVRGTILVIVDYLESIQRVQPTSGRGSTTP